MGSVISWVKERLTVVDERRLLVRGLRPLRHERGAVHHELSETSVRLRDETYSRLRVSVRCALWRSVSAVVITVTCVRG
jgi:hypothetical protein